MLVIFYFDAQMSAKIYIIKVRNMQLRILIGLYLSISLTPSTLLALSRFFSFWLLFLFSLTFALPRSSSLSFSTFWAFLLSLSLSLSRYHYHSLAITLTLWLLLSIFGFCSHSLVLALTLTLTLWLFLAFFLPFLCSLILTLCLSLSLFLYSLTTSLFSFHFLNIQLEFLILPSPDIILFSFGFITIIHPTSFSGTSHNIYRYLKLNGNYSDRVP